MSPLILVRGIVYPAKYFDDDGFISKEDALDACKDLVGKPVNVEHNDTLILGEVSSAFLDDQGNIAVDLVLHAKDAHKYAIGSMYRALALGMEIFTETVPPSISILHVALVAKSMLEGSPIQEAKVASKV